MWTIFVVQKIYKPNSVSSCEVAIIYLGAPLLVRSIELPNLLFHRNGFTTHLRHRRAKRVAGFLRHRITFHLSPCQSWVSIVSVTLSLSFPIQESNCVLLSGISWSPLATFLVNTYFYVLGVRTFLATNVTRSPDFLNTKKLSFFRDFVKRFLAFNHQYPV